MNAGRAFCCALLLAGMPAWSAGAAEPVAAEAHQPAAGVALVPVRALAVPPAAAGAAARAAVRAIALAPDGERLAGVDAAGRILLWRLADGAVSVAGPARDAVLTAVAFAGDGRRLAVSGAAGDGDGAAFVELWDLQTGRRSWRRPAPAAAAALAFAAGAPTLHALSRDCRLVSYHRGNGDQRAARALLPAAQVPGGGCGVSRAAFSADGRLLAAALDCGKSDLFTVQRSTGEVLPYGGSATPALFGFAAGGRALCVCDWRQARRAGRADHPLGAGAVGSLATRSRPGPARGFAAQRLDFDEAAARSRWGLTADGCRQTDLASGRHGPPAGARLLHAHALDERKTDQPPRIEQRFAGGGLILRGGLRSACTAFHPDGRRFIACSGDGRVRLWRIPAAGDRDGQRAQ
jgi:WD40 repeat protein